MTQFPVNRLPRPSLDTSVEPSEQVNSAAVGDRAVGMTAIGQDPLGTIDNAQRSDTFEVDQAKRQHSTSPANTIAQTLEDQSVDSAEELEAQYSESLEKNRILNELKDYYIETGVYSEDTEYSEFDIRYTTNSIIGEQIIRDRIAQVEEDTGIVGTIGDFVDRYFIRQIPIGAIEDLTGRSEREGKDLLGAQLRMDPEEYRVFITNYVNEIAAEGFFTSENLFALREALDKATNAGYDPYTKLNQFLAITEILPLVKGVAKGGKAILRGRTALAHADSVVSRIAATEGQNAGAELGVKIMRSAEEIDGTVAAKVGPKAYDEGTALVRPQSAKAIEILEENAIIREARSLDKVGSFGRVGTANQVTSRVAEIVKDYKARVANPLNDYLPATQRMDLGNNPIAEVNFGKMKDGSAYTGKGALSSATKARDKMNIPEAFVRPLDETDLSKGYVITVHKRLDITDFADEFDPNKVEYGFIREMYARMFGSNAALDDEYLTALANMAEAGQTTIKSLVRPFEKALNKIPKDSKTAVTRVFKELRDGKDAALKEGYTTEEFKEKFRLAHPKGRRATAKDMEAYNALVTFEDAGWFFKANEVLARYVKTGHWALDLDGKSTIGKKVDSLKGETKVLNVKTNAVEKVSELDDAVSVWVLDVPLENGVKHVSNPTSVKILDHTDVMGFNSGGRRINPNANYFVTFMGENPRAFLTAFTQKQADLAVHQLRNIRAAVINAGGDLKTIKSTDELDDLIRVNNDWNPSLTSFKDFSELALRKGWKLTDDISSKERGGEIVDPTKKSPHGGSKWDDYVRTQLHRYNDTLMDFGGGETFNVDPVNAILNEFASATSHYTHRAYSYNASAAWVKRAAQSGSGVKLSDDYPANDYLNQVQHAEISGTSPTAQRMRHQRSIIRRRLNMKGPLAERMAGFGQEVTEFVFESTGLKTNFFKTDPSNTLLNIGFQSAFGFFNVSQFFMQGMHAATISAISPKHGLRAAASTIPMRMAIHAGTPDATRLAVRRLATVLGESEEDMLELVEYFRSSGRHIIDGDAIELGTGPSFGVSGWKENSYLPSVVSDGISKATLGGRRVLDAGLIPFRSGERLGRMTAITTAALEYRAKFGKSILTDEGRRWVTTREQNLTFNMTASGRALFQSGAMKVPTQWLSYSFRSMEAVVLGRGFTKTERTRMAAALFPMYGMTGMGLESASDWATEAFGVEDPETYIAMKYGVIDWLVAEFTPIETAVASRLAPITAFTDLYDKVIGGEASFLEMLGGPSGQITSGILTQFWATMSELYNGHTVSLTQDALNILRQPSGLDNIAKGWGILNNGIYRSKTGSTLPTELKPVSYTHLRAHET